MRVEMIRLLSIHRRCFDYVDTNVDHFGKIQAEASDDALHSFQRRQQILGGYCLNSFQNLSKKNPEKQSRVPFLSSCYSSLLGRIALTFFLPILFKQRERYDVPKQFLKQMILDLRET